MGVEVKIPGIGESVTEVTLASWSVKDGDCVAEGDTLCEIESDKANMEIPAEVSGTITIHKQEGETLPIGEVIATIAPGEVPARVEKKSSDSSSTVFGHPSPSARKILAEKGLNAKTVEGSGRGGRITKSDALSAETPVSPPPSRERGREKRFEKMSRLRKTIAQRLTEAKNSTAMLTTFNEVDMSQAMILRRRYNDDFLKKHGIKLGFMSLFTKASCLALAEVPGVNAQIEGDNIVYHDYCDMGMAISTPKGLVVAVIRNAESLSLAQIELEVKRLAAKAREGKLSLAEMQGGTFTITNGGVFGSMLSTPILNIPQSGILGMHNIVERPVVIDGEMVIRPIMFVALSYDHRVVDGRESVSFLKRVKEYLEDPARMLLDV